MIERITEYTRAWDPLTKTIVVAGTATAIGAVLGLLFGLWIANAYGLGFIVAITLIQVVPR